ncbi:MAG: MBL fold metallo-hydrolase [Acidimicrobiia bacterium]|nr:MBL fold metallo-hydrolase [Acidimicrobiia bacterium]
MNQRPSVFRHVVVLGSALALLVAAQQLRGQQPTGEPFTTAITKLKDGLYVIPGYDGAATGGNVAVRVTSEGVIVVDSKLPTLYDDIVNKVKSVSAHPIRYVLNTHQHGDHTGANAQFLKSADILMHRNARANMLTMKLAGPGRIVYTGQQSVFLGGAEVQMRYLGRGHTNGDSVIYFPDLRTVHTGDLVVWGKRSQGTILTPFMDYAEGHGSGKEWVATLDKLLAIEWDAAIPGHGPVLTKDQVRTFRSRMQTMNDRVAAFIKRGGKKADVAGAITLDDVGWPGAVRGLDGLYDELSR